MSLTLTNGVLEHWPMRAFKVSAIELLLPPLQVPDASLTEIETFFKHRPTRADLLPWDGNAFTREHINLKKNRNISSEKKIYIFYM